MFRGGKDLLCPAHFLSFFASFPRRLPSKASSPRQWLPCPQTLATVCLVCSAPGFAGSKPHCPLLLPDPDQLPGSSGPTCTGPSAEFLKHLRQPSSALFRDLTPSSSSFEFQLSPAPLSPLSWKWYLHNTFTSYYSVSNTQLKSFMLNFVC